MPCDAQNSIGARLTNKLAHTLTLSRTQTFIVSASPLLMHPKHKLSELLRCQMVLFTKAITIQIELEVGREGEGAEDRYETSGGGTAWKMRKH